MITVLAAAILAPTSLELQRGADIGSGLRYWAVEDTFLDGGDQDRNYGRDALLTAGPGRMVLIRFGDLQRAIGGGRRVIEAELRLGIEIGSAPQLRAIARVLQPWGEGPGRRGFFGRRDAPPAGQGPAWSATWRHRHAEKQPIGWQRAGADGPNDLAPLQGATARVDGDELVIGGLGPAVQAMADAWYDNHGFGLQFANAVDFASSDAPQRRPRLLLKLEDSPAAAEPDLSVVGLDVRAAPNGAKDWVATIKNIGTSASRPCGGEWRIGRRRTVPFQVVRALAPGESLEIILRTTSKPDADPRQTEVMAVVVPEGPDARRANNAAVSYENAVPVRLTASTADWRALAATFGVPEDDAFEALFRLANDTVLPHSRFSFAPEGSLERLRLGGLLVVSESATPLRDATDWLRALFQAAGLSGYRDTHWDGAGTGLAPLRRTEDLFPGLMGGGDTRDEGLLPEQLSLPYEPWRDPAILGAYLPSTDLLAATDVIQLAAWRGKAGADRGSWSGMIPKTTVVRVANAWNQPIADLEMEFFPAAGGTIPAIPAFKATTSARGVATLPQPMDGANRLLLVRATRGGVTEYGWLKAWHAVDAKARAGFDVAMVNLVLPLPDQKVDTSANFALDRLILDEAETAPARLATLVDGKADTVCEFAAGHKGWLEIDLGRDRPLGEVRLSFAGAGVWPEFDLRIYGTGERAAEARTWVGEPNGPWSLRTRLDVDAAMPGLKTVAYRGFPVRARFLRLVPRVAAPVPVRLAEVRAFGLAVE